MIQAAVLHDTVEDTDTTFEELEAKFGAEVCQIVREVSDDKSLPKMERKQLQVHLCELLIYYGINFIVWKKFTGEYFTNANISSWYAIQRYQIHYVIRVTF